MESSKKSNKISDIVKLKQKLKKWRKQANSSSTTNLIINNNNNNNNNNTKESSSSKSNSNKGITFLKRTLSFTDISTNGGGLIPKGYLAVQVGEEMKRFVIPTNYLSHPAFTVLLKEAEEEFGFQQEGVLRIPCDVQLFENILKVVDVKNSQDIKQAVTFSRNDSIICGSSESQSHCQSHHPPSQMCR